MFHHCYVQGVDLQLSTHQTQSSHWIIAVWQNVARSEPIGLNSSMLLASKKKISFGISSTNLDSPSEKNSLTTCSSCLRAQPSWKSRVRPKISSFWTHPELRHSTYAIPPGSLRYAIFQLRFSGTSGWILQKRLCHPDPRCMLVATV